MTSIWVVEKAIAFIQYKMAAPHFILRFQWQFWRTIRLITWHFFPFSFDVNYQKNKTDYQKKIIARLNQGYFFIYKKIPHFDTYIRMNQKPKHHHAHGVDYCGKKCFY